MPSKMLVSAVQGPWPAHAWRHVAIAGGSGVLMSLSTAPLNGFPLAWVALAPLWILIQPVEYRLGELLPGELRPVECSRWWILPLVWGIAYHGLALFWITGLHPLTWMGIPWLGSVAIVLFAWGFITLWGAVLVWLWAWGLRWLARGLRHRCGLLLAATALWCGLEWLWSLGPLYWTSLSYTQSPGNVVILHLGQISGPLTVTAAIVAVNGGFALGWMQMRASRPATANSEVAHLETAKSKAARPETARPKMGSRSGANGFGVRAAMAQYGLPIMLCLGLHGVGWGLYSRPLATTPETALKVGIIQGNVPTRIKLSPEGMQRAIAGYTQGYETLADQQVAAVLTPEGALPILWGDRTRQTALYRAVLQRRIPLWLGTFVPDRDKDGVEHYTQSLLTLTAEGQVYSRFNKIKLVPLGEYLPLRGLLAGLIGRLSPMRLDMQPGRPDQIFDTPFGRAIVAICYESAFPAQFRHQAAAGGEFIMTAANLDPYSEVLMAQHQAQDLMRAIETDRWAVRATNTGYSGLIDPHGRVVWRSSPRTYQAQAVTLHRRQTQTLYVRWGNWLTPLLILSSSGFWLFRQGQRYQRERVR
jgi:apolipoprotein N-acyltransferase